MKNFFLFIVGVAVITAAGSVSYYYLVLLPKQGAQNIEDINAIRKVIAPTLQEQQVQQQQQAARDAQTTKAMNDYFACVAQNQTKLSAWIAKQCPTSSQYTLTQAMDCRTKAMASTGAKQFDCKNPFY